MCQAFCEFPTLPTWVAYAKKSAPLLMTLKTSAEKEKGKAPKSLDLNPVPSQIAKVKTKVPYRKTEIFGGRWRKITLIPRRIHPNNAANCIILKSQPLENAAE